MFCCCLSGTYAYFKHTACQSTLYKNAPDNMFLYAHRPC